MAQQVTIDCFILDMPVHGGVTIIDPSVLFELREFIAVNAAETLDMPLTYLDVDLIAIDDQTELWTDEYGNTYDLSAL